jgi:hypothetical protein
MSAALVLASRAGWRRGEALLRPESGASLPSVAGSYRRDDNGRRRHRHEVKRPNVYPSPRCLANGPLDNVEKAARVTSDNTQLTQHSHTRAVSLPCRVERVAVQPPVSARERTPRFGGWRRDALTATSRDRRTALLPKGGVGGRPRLQRRRSVVTGPQPRRSLRDWLGGCSTKPGAVVVQSSRRLPQALRLWVGGAPEPCAAARCARRSW